MKKLSVALFAVGALVLAGAYVWVNSYTQRLQEQERTILEQQQEKYAEARARRASEVRVAIAEEEIRGKLGVIDRPDVELNIIEYEDQDDVLTGVVEIKQPATAEGELETRQQKFRVEFDAEQTVRACVLQDPD